MSERAGGPDTDERPGLIGRAALSLTAWTERWVPDAFIFALLATAIVVVAEQHCKPPQNFEVDNAEQRWQDASINAERTTLRR